MNLSSTMKTGLVAGILMTAALPALSAQIMSVTAREAVMRATPTALGKPEGKIAYGDKVEIVETKGAWNRIRTSANQEGWIHSSSLTKKAVQMSSGGAVDTGASSGEVSLAGKGFNSQVEAQIRNADNAAAFSKVDEIEKLTVPPEKLQRFLDTGDIKPRG